MTFLKNMMTVKDYNDKYCFSTLLPQEFLDSYTTSQPEWGFNGLGYIVYKRTYSRTINETQTEEWWQTVARCINGAQKIGADYTVDEAQRLYDLVFNLKCNFGGRMLWQLGTSTVDRFGLASLLNCFFVAMREPEDFCFLFEHLMLGGGVGYSVKREDIHELPRIKKGVNIFHHNEKDADFIVPDSRQGWVELLRKTLNSFFVSGKSFNYSTILVRGAGEPIKGFGGTASGPQILIEGLQSIIQIFQKREGKKLRSIDVLDINNIIGSIVVAGNVRRSAEVAIGDPDDYLYIRAKNWSDGNIPNWRSMSNNSIYADSFEHISSEIWSNGYILDKKTGNAKGEPYGFMNLPLCKKYGRLGEERYDNCEGGNPCMEITLADGEACNLCELYLNNISSKEELFECARLLYKTQKAVWTLPALYEKTKIIGQKNMRIGLGVTGVCQSLDKVEWLDDCYNQLREFDKAWSAKKGYPESIKLTTIKPSGCSKKETMIITSEGLLTLEELGHLDGPKWQDHNFDVSQEYGTEGSTKFYINGKVKTKKILTSGGIELECSLNHRYRVLENGDYIWKTASDMVPGDILPFRVGGYDGFGAIQQLVSIVYDKITNSIPMIQPDKLDEDLAWFLGLYLADGSTHAKGIRIAGDKNKPEIFDKAVNIIKNKFQLSPIIYGRSNGNGSDLYVNSQQLLKWLGANGLIKQKTLDIEIPKIVRMSPKSVILSYIDGYGCGDGSIKTNGRSFCTTSKRMAEQLVVVARACGLDTKMRMMPPTDTSLGNNMRYWISERKGRASNPRYISKHVREIWDQLDIHGLCDFNFDTVISIEDGETETYDIEVPKNNTYIAESYISHNTLSLLGGSTPGVHPSYSQYYIRRIRMSSGDPLVKTCKEYGYKTEYVLKYDGTEDYSTIIVEFPCYAGEDVIVAKNMTALNQLELVKNLQTVWSDNSVSVTVYYTPEELESIQEWLKNNYEQSSKTLSFLLHSKHGFAQAPYEEIDEKTYQRLIKKIKPLENITSISSKLLEGIECEGGSCPIR